MRELAKNIQWLGHDGFFISGSKKVCIDPFELKSFSKKADILLVSHEHFDHCHPESIKKVCDSKTIVLASPLAAKKIGGSAKPILPGQTVSLGSVSVTAVPAYNISKFRELGKVFHPKEDKNVGFVIEMDGKRYYHAGDTDFVPEMKQLKKIDVAFLPVSGTYVMTAKEAAQAANAIKPKLAIPMHYGSIVGTSKDAQEFKKRTTVLVEILQSQ